MEWHWCGLDGDCLASWFWSSATAAWIQAFVAITAIIFANTRAKQSFKAAIELDEKRADLARQEEYRREHLNQSKNLARVKVVISNIVSSMEIVLRTKAQNGGGFITAQLKGAITEILEGKDLLRRLIMDDFPHPYLLAYINASATLTADFASFCRHQLEEGVPAAHTESGIREFIRDMTRYHDVLQEFHDRFATDPEAEFNPHRLRETEAVGN